MTDNYLDACNNELDMKKFNVKKMLRYDEEGIVFVELTNGQRMLVDKTLVYKIPTHKAFVNCLSLKGINYGIFQEYGKLQVINLKTNEMIFEDYDAYSIFKHGEDNLYVIMHSNGSKIYNIKNREYLNAPQNYKYESTLKDELFVYVEKDSKDKEKEFYDLKRIVINTNGDILLKDIQGWIYYKEDKIYIIKKDSISIASIGENAILKINTLEKNDHIIANPQYSDGNIMLVEKNKVKVYNGDLEEIKAIDVDGLEEVTDIYHSNGMLYMTIPYQEREKTRYKILLVNTANQKIVMHKQIEWYPYWTPTTFVATDDIDSKEKEYHFYDKELNLLTDIKAKCCDNVDDSRKESIFLLETVEGKNILYNPENNRMKEVDYGDAKFHIENEYGYGINYLNNTMDFLNRDLEVVTSKDYEENTAAHHFNYWILNNYIYFTQSYIDGYGISRTRHTLRQVNGEEVFDSLTTRCIIMGDFFQIVSGHHTKFLNTKTGEMGKIKLIAPVNNEGEIDFKKLKTSSHLLSLGGIVEGALEDTKQKQKTKGAI